MKQTRAIRIALLAVFLTIGLSLDFFAQNQFYQILHRTPNKPSQLHSMSSYDSTFFFCGVTTFFNKSVSVWGNFNSQGQVGTLNYFDTPGNSASYNIVLDQIGNSYLSGYSSEAGNVNPGGLIAKVDNNGNTIWAIISQTSQVDYFKGLCIDFQNDVISTGSFNGPLLLSSFYLKIDSSGSYIDSKRISSSSGNLDTEEIISTDDGGVVLSFTGNITSGNIDVFGLIKLDSLGDTVWTKAMPRRFNTRIMNLIKDSQGNIFALGHYSDPSMSNLAMLAMKFDSNGGLLWAKALMSQTEEIGYSAFFDYENNIVVCGHSIDTLDDALFVKIDTNGTLIKAKAAGNWASDRVFASAIGQNGDYFFGGFSDGYYGAPFHDALRIFKLTPEFEPLCDARPLALRDSAISFPILSFPISVQSQVISFTGIAFSPIALDFETDTLCYITCNLQASIQANGSIECAGDSLESAWVDVQGSNGSLEVIWNYGAQTIQADTVFNLPAGTVSVQIFDSVGCSLRDTIVISEPQRIEFSQNASVCQGDTLWIQNSAYYQSGVYVDTLTSVNGCDSILTTNLSILNSATSSIDTSICEGDILILNGVTYSASGAFSQVLTGSNSCDSILSISVNLISRPVPSIFPADTSVSNCSEMFVLVLDSTFDNSIFNLVGPGLSGTYFDPKGLAPGSYQVVFSETNSGCTHSDTSRILVTPCSSVSDYDCQVDMKVFPSPGSGILFISGIPSGKEMKIFNPLGQLLWKGVSINGLNQIDLSTFSMGMYILTVPDCPTFKFEIQVD